MVTVEEIYENMKSTYLEKTGSEIGDSSDMAVRMYAAAAEICSLYAYNDWVKRQAFPQTADGINLDYHAEMRGLARHGGKCAEGTVTFYTDVTRSSDLTVPAGTVCYTQFGTRFFTTEDGVISGGETSVDIPCRCETEGEDGNVAAGTVIFMALRPAGIIRCENAASFYGGMDEENDDSLRERVLKSYRTLPNGANAAYYEKEVLQTDNVSAVKVLPKNRGIGTVDVVISAVSGMPDAQLINTVKSVLDEKREICVDIEVLSPTAVTVPVSAEIDVEAGYDYSAAAQEVENRLAGFFGGELLGQNVLIAQLADIIYSTEGVRNYRISLPSSDVTVSETELPVAGTIQISPMGE